MIQAAYLDDWHFRGNKDLKNWFWKKNVKVMEYQCSILPFLKKKFQEFQEQLNTRRSIKKFKKKESEMRISQW